MPDEDLNFVSYSTLPERIFGIGVIIPDQIYWPFIVRLYSHTREFCIPRIFICSKILWWHSRKGFDIPLFLAKMRLLNPCSYVPQRWRNKVTLRYIGILEYYYNSYIWKLAGTSNEFTQKSVLYVYILL